MVVYCCVTLDGERYREEGCIYLAVGDRVLGSGLLRPFIALVLLSFAVVLYVIGSPLLGHPPFEEACVCIGGPPPESALEGRWAIAILEPEDVGRSELVMVKNSSSLTLAYLNFGYAEEWREYWGFINSTGIVHGESPEYEGEYFIEYWSEEWLNITASLAVDYLSRGFDGVLLDNIDACEAIEGMPWAPPDPCSLMASSVSELAHRIRSEYPGAAVFVNIGTALELLTNTSFLNEIDGVLREEVWYVWVAPCESAPTPPSDRQEALHYLEIAKAAGKVVLVADFVDSVVEASEVCWGAWSWGFIPVPQPACDHDYTRPPSYVGCTLSSYVVPRLVIGST